MLLSRIEKSEFGSGRSVEGECERCTRPAPHWLYERLTGATAWWDVDAEEGHGSALDLQQPILPNESRTNNSRRASCIPQDNK